MSLESSLAGAEDDKFENKKKVGGVELERSECLSDLCTSLLMSAQWLDATLATTNNWFALWAMQSLGFDKIKEYIQ